jgi:hypothetical protein
MIAVYMVMVSTSRLQDFETKSDASSATDVQLERLILLRKFWGSIGSAVMSAIWSITGGADWESVISPLVEETGNQFHNIIFTMFIAFSTMVIMNLVTGVFVEGAQRLKKEDRDRELIRMAHRTFNVVDNDSSEDVTRDEFDQHMEEGHMDAYLAAMDLSKTSACDLFELIDDDNSGKINVHEFVTGCMRLKGMPRAADVSQILVDVRKLAKNLDYEKQITDAKADEYQRRMEAMLGDLATLAEQAMLPPVPESMPPRMPPAVPPVLPCFSKDGDSETHDLAIHPGTSLPSLQCDPEKQDLDWFVQSRELLS